MAIDQMDEGEIFLPREEWGELDLRSSSNPWLILVEACLAIVACVLMVLGEGGPWTWWGGLLFVAVLTSFTVTAFRGIEGQNAAVEELERGEGDRTR